MAKSRQRRFDANDDLLDAPVSVSLDLHGRRAAEVPRLVESFLATQARVRPGEVVRIITGRGKGSAGGSVLRPIVRDILRRLSGSIVKESDRDVDEGSFLVRLQGLGR